MADRYAFLDLLKEQEALARGANLGDKVHHAIYKAIKTNSSVEAVRHNTLYNVGVNVPEVLHLTKKDLVTVLSRLVSERLITQIFIFIFEPGSPKPTFRPSFISIPPEEKQSTGQLYQETIQQSVRAIESYIESLPPVNADMIWSDLETDLTMEETPQPADVPSSILDIFSGVHAASFDVVPAPEMIQTTLADLQEQLSKKGKLLHVLDYGFMPLRDREVLDRVESAGDFLLSKVIPKYKSRGSLKSELEQIQLEEAAYYLNENVPRTAEFLARRASAIKKTILSDPGRKGGVRYPGALCAETLLLAEPFSRQKYADQWKAEVNSQHNSFKDRLRKESNQWDELIIFLEEKDALAFPKEVWKRITEDRDILHHTWEKQGATLHVFVRKDPEVFRVFVEGMVALPVSEHWKILAMKSLLDRYEGHVSQLFHDEAFVRSYGKLLRIAYIDYIPWYFRIFIWLGLNWFQDRSFQIAKNAISIEQKYLAGANQQKAGELAQARETEKRQMMARIQEMSVTNQIVEALDRFYHTELWIPTVADVQAAIKDLDPASFREALNRDRFQIVRDGKDKPDYDILVYPMNHEWRVRAARLRRALDRIMARYPEAMQSDEAQSMHDRIRRLTKFLSRKEHEIPALDREDPYRKFEKALKSHEQKAAKSPAAEELEV